MNSCDIIYIQPIYKSNKSPLYSVLSLWAGNAKVGQCDKKELFPEFNRKKFLPYKGQESLL
jgi:hypothetical protein